MSNYLTISRTYLDNDVLYEADLNNICTSIETFLNSTKLNNDNLASSITTAFATTGAIAMFSSASVPSGWIECDGSAVSQTTYAALYAVVGTTYNTGGEGAGNFRLPNYQRRVPVGRGGSGTAVLGNTLGNSGGAETVALNDPMYLPAHTHADSVGHAHGEQARNNVSSTIVDALATNNNSGVSHTLADNTAASDVTFNSNGSNAAHNNVQPSLVMLFMIKT